MKSKKYVIYVKKVFCDDKNWKKVRYHGHYIGKFKGAAHSVCNLRNKLPKEIPLVFHNGSTYDYHFIIKNYQKNLKVNLNA